MAKAVYLCVRNHDHILQIRKKVAVATKILVPDNIPDASCKIEETGNIIYGIANYSDVIAEHNGSICMGIAYPEQKNWWTPLGAYPDGSFAIFRSDDNFVEAVTDTTASRTIWYYKDDTIFICSTSQRAIITVLGKFDFDKRAIPWMLSSGSLGPTLSWCKNLSRLEPQASLLLNRKSWQLTKNNEAVIFSSVDAAPAKHYKNLQDSLVNSFKDFKFDTSKWVLPLSGGYDSRAIACLLKASGKHLAQIDSVTWGLKESLNNKNNDAYVATLVAKELGMPHQYLATDKKEVNIETVFNRFVLNSEGRVDHIEGYTDGFNLWKILFDNKKLGIIRGDEGFGWGKVTDAKRVRYMCGLTLCKDFSNLENYESFGFEKQELPDNLQLRKGETPQMLIDRYYVSFRIPTIMAALNDLKLSYVEVVNPLLSRQILMQMRSIPDPLRIDRKAFIEAMKELVPDIRYATEEATHVKGNVFKSPEAITLMKEELNAGYMKYLFPEAFIKKILDKLQQPEGVKKAGGFKNKLRRIIRLYFPSRLKESLYNLMGKPVIDNSTVAFRIYLTGKMYKQLTQDAAISVE